MADCCSSKGAVPPCRPRLFVYELPDAYRVTKNQSGGDNEQESGTPGATTSRGRGRIVTRLDHGYEADQYSLAALLYQRALSWRCRVHEPTLADLFWVPAFRDSLPWAFEHGSRWSETRCIGPCAEGHASRKGALVERLRLPLHRAGGDSSHERTSTLEARGGADHIFLNPRSGQAWERSPFCELAFGDPAFGAASFFAMEEAPRPKSHPSWVYPEGYCGKVCVAAYHPQALPEALYWSVPWTSTIHLQGPDGHSSEQGGPPWARGWPASASANDGTALTPSPPNSGSSSPSSSPSSRSPSTSTRPGHAEARPSRPTLVAYVAMTWQRCCTGVGRQLPKPTLWLREKLVQQCKAAPALCTYAAPESAERTAAIYRGATFCLHPGGDTLTRKGILDSLLLGCIPVLFHVGQAEQWRWHWGSWVHSATISLNQSAVRHGDLDVVRYLAALPRSRIQALRAALVRHAHRMHYAAVDTSALAHGSVHVQQEPDAFDLILLGAHQVAKDVKLQELGRELQRTRKGSRAVMERRFEVGTGLKVEQLM